MLSTEIAKPFPDSDEQQTMSYAFGPHMQGSETGIYFTGDNRVVRCPVNEIPLPQEPPPAWLVADWMLADKRGEAISEYARLFVENKDSWNSALLWLHNLLIAR